MLVIRAFQAPGFPDDGYRFKPLWLSRYVQAALFKLLCFKSLYFTSMWFNLACFTPLYMARSGHVEEKT